MITFGYSPRMSVDTRKAERRSLRFGSLEDLDAELDRLERAHAAGTLTHTGNYAPGQALHHLARWMERYRTRDLPKGLPLHMRIVGRLMRGRVFEKGFPAGLPGPEGKTQPEPDVPFQEGLAYLRRMHEALRQDDFAQPNEFLGPVSHADVITLHLRHAELHLGFLHPDNERA